MNFNGPFEAEGATETDRAAEQPSHGGEHRGRRGRLILLGVVVLAAALTAGAWIHLTQYRLSADAAEQERDFVPQVSVASVESSGDTEVVKLPATTSAFASANIFARASGYIAKREVDIGDRVKQGQLLVEIVAPELDHQIAQAEATLGQLKWALQQAEANRELVKVTWDRDKPLVQKGWVTAQQGTIDEQTLKAQEAAVSVAQANVTAEEDSVLSLSRCVFGFVYWRLQLQPDRWNYGRMPTSRPPILANMDEPAPTISRCDASNRLATPSSQWR